MGTVHVIHKFTKVTPADGTIVIDACNNSPTGEFAGINPFLNGPCELYGGHTALRMENAWQFSKLYAEHADANGNPTDKYWEWATNGWNNPQSIRFPMGRGARPLHCWWNGRKLPYVESRKVIYGPLFIKATRDTESYKKLVELHNTHQHLYIRDWDGWDMKRHKMSSLTQVLHNGQRKMGHGFFLKAMLENDKVLQFLEM